MGLSPLILTIYFTKEDSKINPKEAPPKQWDGLNSMFLAVKSQLH